MYSRYRLCYRITGSNAAGNKNELYIECSSFFDCDENITIKMIHENHAGNVQIKIVKCTNVREHSKI